MEKYYTQELEVKKMTNYYEICEEDNPSYPSQAELISEYEEYDN